MFMYPNLFMIEEVLLTLIPALLSSIPSCAFGIVAYILTALALYTLAKRRGISHGWMSWVPILNLWILGSLSDQYRYVVKGQIKSKRKLLLILNIVNSVIALTIMVVAIVMAVELFGVMNYNISDDRLMEMVLGPMVAVVGLCLPLMGISIALAVIRYMALYDLYTSMDPANSVLFLVLSIFFGFTEPFFLFFNRNKEKGMPPRKPSPEQTPPEESWQEPIPDPWQDDRDYL